MIPKPTIPITAETRVVHSTIERDGRPSLLVLVGPKRARRRAWFWRPLQPPEQICGAAVEYVDGRARFYPLQRRATIGT